ncbi:MAG: hypothetical protein GPJ51_08260, partial [Candidatus Heimdallarchaeota archaeon]|nr:hypothetical protein [Candidatus Heimdallarchaeota archaeon]
IGVWTSQTPIYHSLGYYPTGDYEFSIYVYDDYGQCTNDTVLVQIRDLAAPVVNSPVDIIIEESATGQYVEWTAVDVHPKSYELLRDGIAIDSGTWDAYTLLRFSLDSLILGRYNYCLILTDVSNNIATDCVNVEVVETTRSGSVSIIVNLLIIITLASISSILKRRFN